MVYGTEDTKIYQRMCKEASKGGWTRALKETLKYDAMRLAHYMHVPHWLARMMWKLDNTNPKQQTKPNRVNSLFKKIKKQINEGINSFDTVTGYASNQTEGLFICETAKIHNVDTNATFTKNTVTFELIVTLL